jgi:hypothetical protein
MRTFAAIFGLAACITALWGCFHRYYNDPHHCLTNDDCTLPGLSVCDRGDCVASLTDGSPGDLPVVACSTSATCTIPAEPICDLDAGLCRPCAVPDGGATSSECVMRSSATPYCNGGACVECRNSRDCLSVNKACDQTAGSCVPCAKNDDCASGLCVTSTMSCEDPTNLVYVQSTGMSCPTGTGAGKLDDPFCKLQTGINQGATMNKTVIVLGGTYAENITIAPMGTYVLHVIGIGQPVLAPSSAGPALQINNSSQTAGITLDGLTIQNATGSSGSGIVCNGNTSTSSSTTLKVLRSTIRNNSAIGLNIIGCDITVDQTTVAMNAGGGVNLAFNSFTVQNTVVWSNGSSTSSFGGLTMMNPGTTAVIVNSDFIANQNMTGAMGVSGLGCAGTPIVFNIVVRDNSGVMMEMNSGVCKPNYSAFVGAALVTGVMGNQDLTTCPSTSLFQNPMAGNFHPTAGTPPCTLVNDGTAMFGGVNAPAYDIEGTMRPQGGAFDIGAYEAP